MYDPTLVLDVIDNAAEAPRRIEWRFQGISCPEDFVRGDEGLEKLDSIAMMLLVVGESVRRIDRMTEGELLQAAPCIPWKKIKGIRDVLAHGYFDIDHEILFEVCAHEIDSLREAMSVMRERLLRERDGDINLET
ncbi:MAG: DUF86 domain-containing protein [Synergistales bacterium]|nr:DUF86 domain-containing protein [Synergistales bacterium]